MDDIKGRRSIHSSMSSPKSPKSPKRPHRISSDKSDSDVSTSEDETFQTNQSFLSESYSSNQSVSTNPNQSVTYKSESGYNTTLIFSVIVVAVCSYVIYDYYRYEPEIDTINYDLITQRLEKLMRKYPHQNLNNWFAFSSGIEDVFEQNRPSIFLLLYTAESKSVMVSIVRAIAQLSSEVLFGGLKPVELEADVLNRNTKYVRDHGRFLVDYRDRLSIFILHDLHRLHPEIAKALHGICDEITPLMRKSVVLLTAEVKDLNAGKEAYLAEMLLKDAWGAEIDNDILWPLITRVTGSVMKIVPEN